LSGSWEVRLETHPETLDVTAAPATFGDFFGAHQARLGRACLLLTGNPTEAEDLAQESMARIFERWDRVSEMDDPEGYLFRTALNLHRNALRRLSVAARREVVGSRIDDEDATDRSLDIRQAIRSLPVKQRQALVLVEWLRYSSEQAAQILGIDAVSVRGRLHRARSALRHRYGGLDE
jgi:RNA polymerase sigma factor (sigma-70 family)